VSAAPRAGTRRSSRPPRSHELVAVNRALRVLETFSDARPRRSLSAIAADVGLDKAVVHRILQAFVGRGLMGRDMATEEYFITPAVLRWVFAVPGFRQLRALALPEMLRLRDLSRETVFLSMIDGDHRISVFQLESPHQIKRTVPLGVRHRILYGATGKAALAFLPPARIRRILDRTPLDRLAAGTIVTRPALESDLKRTRARGYAVGLQEEVPNVAGVASPLFGRAGEVVAVLTVTGPLERFRAEARARIAPFLLASARQISQQLGYAEAWGVSGDG
jgi:IclR family transcriptional regulator, acetate operon repressor